MNTLYNPEHQTHIGTTTTSLYPNLSFHESYYEKKSKKTFVEYVESWRKRFKCIHNTSGNLVILHILTPLRNLNKLIIEFRKPWFSKK